MSTELDHPQKSALLAISGGQDSIVLLHLLASELAKNTALKNNKLTELIKDFISLNSLTKLELAYIDHAQRDDILEDIKVIKKLSDKFNLKLHISKLDLPKDASEGSARALRYQKLEEIKQGKGLNHIITAHHADDVIETALINLIRGTGPKGLSSLRHHPDGIWRPYLSKLNKEVFIRKLDLEEYAKEHNLKWHEDSTNKTSKYLRNRIRQSISIEPKQDKDNLLKIVVNQAKNTLEVDLLTDRITDCLEGPEPNTYNRVEFLDLSQDIQKQILHKLISQNGYDINRQSVDRAQKFIKYAETKKILQLKGCDITIATKISFTIEPARQMTNREDIGDKKPLEVI